MRAGPWVVIPALAIACARHAESSGPAATGFEARGATTDAVAADGGKRVDPASDPDRAAATASAPEATAEEDSALRDRTRYRVPIEGSPVRGGAAALITVVEFSDYECPFCARAEDTLRELRARYGAALRVVFKDTPLPFHPLAEPAAEAALEVRAEKGDEAFWAMHDALFAHQPSLTPDLLVQLAEAAGAQPERVRRAIATHSHAGDIAVDEDVADDLEAEGTPHFFINGRRVRGAQPTSVFAAIIDEELRGAERLVASGTAPQAVYDALTKDGVAPPEPDRLVSDGLPRGDPARGPANAKVTVHEFADFQCAFCARAEPTLRLLSASYPTELRFVWHDLPLPFHADALPAARAAREARKQRSERGFWDLHDKFFADGAKLSRQDLDTQARAVGLDMTTWRAALDGDAHRAEIDADRAAAEALGITGTPSFIIVPRGATSGYVIIGAHGYGKFRRLVDRALSEAR